MAVITALVLIANTGHFGTSGTTVSMAAATVRETQSMIEPPPGGLVTSTPNIGWTPGQFSVSDDGATRYVVPLWVPAGRGAVTPQLSLSYNSRAGNGLLGVGWSLGGVSTITWCGRTIAQDGYTDFGHFDGGDGLCLDGNRLVPISPPSSPQREYRTEREPFTQIIGYNTQDNVPDYFKVFMKDGKILTFGDKPEARVQPYVLTGSWSSSNEPVLVRAPGQPRATTAWALDRVEDRNGNAATIEYTRAEGGETGQWWMEQRPARIRYAPNRSVEFHYEMNRPDKMDGFVGGTHTRTAARMDRIEMWGGPEGATAELLRQYKILYRSNSITNRSLLTSITECDRDEKCKVSLPFEYSLGSYDFDELDIDASDPALVSVVDVNGDGRSDLILDDNGRRELRVATPLNGIVRQDTFSGPRDSKLPSLAVSLRTVDVDADGRPEMLAEVSKPDGYIYQLYQPKFDPTTGSSFELVPGTVGEYRSSTSNSPPVYLADLDGNGLPDFVLPGSYRLNTGATGADRFGPKVETNDRRNVDIATFAVDTNGDGRTELIGVGNSDRGWVSWGLRADGKEQVSSVNLVGGPISTHFGDVNGDGLVDAVMPNETSDHDELRVQLNSGNGFGSPSIAPSPFNYAPPSFQGALVDTGVRIVDFNGDGREDILVFHAGKPSPGDTSRGLQVYLWTDNAFVRAPINLDIGRSGQETWWGNTQVVDLDGNGVLDLVNVGTDGRLRAFKRSGGAPDQLIAIGEVSSGGRTEIGYTTLAVGYGGGTGGGVGDRAVHTPGTCAYPQTCPRSGGSVVASHRITSDRGTGTAVTWDDYRHTYKAARASLQGRGWLGFAEHTVLRVTTGATTVTEFDNVTIDTGAKSYPFANLPMKQTYTIRDRNDATGREFRSTTTNAYENRRFSSGTYMVQGRTATVAEEERAVGASAWQSLRSTTIETSYDDFGNPDVIKSTTKNGRSVTQNFDYRNDTAAWLIGLPIRTLSTGCTSAAVCTTRESAFDYDDQGNPTIMVVEPNNPALKLTTTTGYGEFGVVTSVTRTGSAGQSRKETREYDNADRLYPTATINAAGHRTLVDTHSGLGVPISITDPNGVKTTFRYDLFARLRETNRADGSFERVSHGNVAGRQVSTTTLAGGAETTEVLDQLGRIRERRVKSFDGRTAIVYTDYDPLGRGVWRTSRATLPGEAPQYVVTLYDNRGRVTSVTEPNGAQVRYDYLNLETHSYDAKGGHSYTVATVNAQVDSLYEDDPDSSDWLRTQFKYGPFGETVSILGPDGTVQTIDYDPIGRRNRLEDPSSGATVTTYNAFGEVATLTDPENRITTFEYDALGRLTKRTSPDGVATNTWDTAPHGVGKLAEARSADDIGAGYTYDALGRDATREWVIAGTHYEFRYTYDDRGRLQCLTYPVIPGVVPAGGADRLAVGNVYNASGYLAEVKQGCLDGGEVYWAAEARNGAGQLERERLGNGVVTARSYRPDTGLLDRILASGPGTVDKLMEIAYDYDENRNVIQRSDLPRQRVERYRYDVLNRLTAWSVQNAEPTQPAFNSTYSYDIVGNLKNETEQAPNQPEKITTYLYGQDGAPPHALTARNDEEYRYNRAGQQTSGPRRTVQYNTFGLPTMLNWSTAQGEARHTEFAYDSGGTRVLERDGDKTTVTVAGLFERRAAAATGGNEIHNLHNILVEGRVVAQVDRVQVASGALDPLSRLTYLHSDLQGSTVALSDRKGAPIGDGDLWLGQQLYDPFGRRIDARNGPLDNTRWGGPRQGYTGHEHDDEYGLINMGGRIYDPVARRFLTPDPTEGPVSSQSYNRYSYVQNNPATLTDPTGFVPNPADGFSDPARDDAFAEASASLMSPDAQYGGYSATPAPSAPKGGSRSDDSASRVDVVEQPPTVILGSAWYEGAGTVVERAGKVAAGVAANLLVGAVELVFGGSVANAPGPRDRTYPRQTYTEQAINIAVAEVGGKLIGKAASWAKGKIFKPSASTGILTDVNLASGGAGPVRAGQEGLAAAGVVQNTTRIASASGTARFRVPDVLNPQAGIIGEVKNVSRLGYTNQLKDYVAYAKQLGYTFELTVRPTTRLSGPLEQAVRSGDVVLKFLP